MRDCDIYILFLFVFKGVSYGRLCYTRIRFLFKECLLIRNLNKPHTHTSFEPANSTQGIPFLLSPIPPYPLPVDPTHLFT